MIKEKELTEFRQPLKYKDAKDVTLTQIQSLLQEEADANGISVAFWEDEIKYGGLFGDTEPCLVLCHPEHEKDYFKFCIKLKHQGNYAFISVFEFGQSTQMGNAGSKEYLKEAFSRGDGWEIGGALIGTAIRRLTKGGSNKKKLEEEEMWYSTISDIFDAVIS